MGNITSPNFLPKDAGSVRHAVGSFKGSSSYSTGGETISAKECGLTIFFAMNSFVGLVGSTPTYIGVFAPAQDTKLGVTSGKIVCTNLSDGAEVTAAVDLSAVTFVGVIAHGR